MALPITQIKEHQEDVIQQAREQNSKLTDLNESLKASGVLMRDAIADGDVNLQRSLKSERDGLKDEISSLEAEISSADAKQLIYEQKNEKTLNGVLGTLLGIQKFDRDGLSRQSKFWGKYFGTPGDFRQKFQGIADIGKNISASFDKIPGVQAIKSGIGTFFDIIKAGLMLVGGLVALQAFVSGFGKASERLGKGDLIAKFSSGLASIVQVFTGMDEEKTIELAKSLDYGFNKIKDILIGITSSLGRVLGVVPRIEGETDTIGTYLLDYGVALVTLGAIFPKLTLALFNLGKFTLLKIIPTIVGMGASLLSTLMGATVTIGMISVPLLPLIAIAAAVIATITLAVLGVKKLMSMAKEVGGFTNLFSLAIAHIKDGFVNMVNGVVNFINGMIEMIPYPLTPTFRIPQLEGGGNVAQVKAKIAADVEKLEKEKADEPTAAGATVPGNNAPSSVMLNAPTSVVNNNSNTTMQAPLRPEPGASNSYRYTNSYVPN